MHLSKRVTLEAVRNPERFQYQPDFLPSAIAEATGRIKLVMEDFIHDYPSASSTGLVYDKQDHLVDWVQGFWTGMLWISYELSGNAIFRAVAEAQYDDYDQRLSDFLGLSHHDVGFLYVPSVLAQYKITGRKKARELALKAADVLSRRFSEKAGIIQVRDNNSQGAFIIDCSMNIPLLFWASQATGDRSYYLKALSHITRVCQYMIRDDASSYQQYKIDELTGTPLFGSQGQGYDDNSCWARGQTWAIYGLALAYRYTKEPEFLEMGKRISNYYLNRLPSDLICNWDLIFTQDDCQRDSSAAPIAACGLLELAKHLDASDPHKELYQNAAGAMMMRLHQDYFIRNQRSNGLLAHGVYAKIGRPGKGNAGQGDDECCIWGDYFYMEGLIRMNQDWNPYW